LGVVLMAKGARRNQGSRKPDLAGENRPQFDYAVKMMKLLRVNEL
jgi:hypothetical protein